LTGTRDYGWSFVRHGVGCALQNLVSFTCTQDAQLSAICWKLEHRFAKQNLDSPQLEAHFFYHLTGSINLRFFMPSVSTHETICLGLLGGFRLLRANVEVSLPHKSARALLAFLVLNPGRTTRSQLVARLWADVSELTARRRLSQALWRLFQALPELETVLCSDAESLWLSSAKTLEVDVMRFETRLQTAGGLLSDRELEAHQSGLLSYLGELLPDWNDDWILEHRERFKGLCITGLARVTAALEWREQPDAALEMARLWAAADPFDEASHRAIMRFEAALGRTTRALEQFEALRELFEHELGVLPQPETQQLRQSLQAGLIERDAPPQFGLQHTGLIGREQERSQILNAFNRSNIVLLEAEAGVGKTRLLQELNADAVWQDAEILWAQSREFASPKAFAPLLEALRAHLTPARASRLARKLEPVWLSAAARVIPELPASAVFTDLGGSEEALRIQESLYRVFAELSHQGRYWLIVDDAQWADEGTLAVLARLARNLPEGFGLVVAYRPSDARERQSVWQCLQALSLVAQRVQLAPLTSEQALRLARASLGFTANSSLSEFGSSLHTLIERVVRETVGQPLYLLETLRALLERGLVRRERGAWQIESTAALPLGNGLQQTIIGRLSRLNHHSRTLLNVIALLNQAVSFELLLEMIEFDPDQTAQAVDQLERHGWVVRHGVLYQIAHDLLRTAIVTELEPAERQKLHAKIADFLLDVTFSNLALHQEGAERWADAAQSHVQAASEALEHHDYRAAFAHLEKTITSPLFETLSVDAVYEALELLWKAATVLSETSAQERCLDLLEATQVEPARILSTALRRAELLSNGGQFEPSVQLALHCKSSAEAVQLPEVVAQAAKSLRRIYNNNGQFEQSIVYSLEAVKYFGAIHDTKSEATALLNLGGDQNYLGRTQEAYQTLFKAQNLFQTINHRQGYAGTLGSLAVIEASRNHHERARAMQLEALGVAREIGWLESEVICLHNLGWAAINCLQLADGLDWYEQALKANVQIANINKEMHVRRSIMGVYVVQLGNWEGANQHLEIIEAHTRQTGNPRNQWYDLEARQIMAVQQRDHARAFVLLEQMYAVATTNHDAPFQLLTRWSKHRLRSQIGEAGGLQDFMQLEPEILALDMPSIMVDFHAQLGALLLKTGAAASALERFEQSLRTLSLENGSQSAYAPDTNHQRALALAQLGRYEESRQALQLAHQELMLVFAGIADHDRQQAFERVPEWRELIKDWEHQHLRRLTTDLPLSGKTTRITVQFTLETPEDSHIHSKTKRRHNQLERVLREANQQGVVARVADLANLFGCGTATIKRDLAALRNKTSSQTI
jgi:DNA-binding SARP family transcriptional activator/tetratricopeptide (TPR) repeat protein